MEKLKKDLRVLRVAGMSAGDRVEYYDWFIRITRNFYIIKVGKS